MSDPENFLSRWSRRKLDTEQEEESRSSEQSPSARPRESGDPEPDQETAESAALDSQHKASEATPSLTAMRGNERSPGSDDINEPPFDLSTLPSIESITAETDIRVFLQKGVPAALTRAALRRAWTADPAIRDFIEMAENQWDFATGKDLPGFGSLDASADDIRKMVAEVFGEGLKPSAEAAAKTAPNTAETPAETGQPETAGNAVELPKAQEIAAAAKDQPPPESAPAEPANDIAQRNKVNIAMQQNNQNSEYEPLPTRRPHGRALPQ